MPHATSLAAELKRNFGEESTLIRGDKGIFDVQADGQIIFSKHKVGRFPLQGEVAAIIKERQETQK